MAAASFSLCELRNSVWVLSVRRLPLPGCSHGVAEVFMRWDLSNVLAWAMASFLLGALPAAAAQALAAAPANSHIQPDPIRAHEQALPGLLIETLGGGEREPLAPIEDAVR